MWVFLSLPCWNHVLISKAGVAREYSSLIREAWVKSPLQEPGLVSSPLKLHGQRGKNVTPKGKLKYHT